ncbi:UDP-N-acetylmuramoyl-tripeptide--D-alanyl-D-alanine ligase [Patescibacteria group bacterium]|nr:UDP-N-acetylmuramoyl-tripeptide--D-alanyl-D-alanine ligase [Patescibacteria group bacterium]
MIRLLFAFVFLIISYIEFSFVTYYFQIKEYRFDRLLSYIKEKGLGFFIFPERLFFPKKSVRNRNIFIVHTILILVYLGFVLVLTKDIYILILFLTMVPVVTILNILIGVLYTSIVVKRKRGDTIRQAADLIKESKAIFIGITGSFGKTSTKEFLYSILNQSFNVGKTDENQNTDVGIAMSINKNLNKDTDIFIFEAGAYSIGEIKKIVSWIKPKYGILTGLGNQHLSLFGSRENLIKAKSELFEILPSNGAAYINKDSSGYKKVLEILKCSAVLYSGTDLDADIYLKKYLKNNISDNFNVTISYKGEDLNFVSRLIGRHNIVNLLPCIALALDLGVSRDLVKQELESMNQVSGKLSKHRGLNEATYLNDSYSSNLDGFLSAIDVMKDIDGKRKIIITKGIIELGKEMGSSYSKILSMTNNDNMLIYTTDKLLKKLDTVGIVTIFKNENQILNHLMREINKDDLILIEGRFSDRFLFKLNLE